jgi:hypothetical protein
MTYLYQYLSQNVIVNRLFSFFMDEIASVKLLKTTIFIN